MNIERLSIQEIDRLIKLLYKLDQHYIPPISQSVCIETYAEKLIENADNLIINVSGMDVALLAIYTNTYETLTSFISSIGVLPNFQGLGIGVKLLEKAFELSKQKMMKFIRLEVSLDNLKALEFYRSKGFIIEKENPDKNSVYMISKISVL